MIITIFGRPNCPYCDKAKALLELLKNQGRLTDGCYIDMHEHGITKADLQRTLGDVNTVPQVVIDQKHIGGYEEFAKHVGANP